MPEGLDIDLKQPLNGTMAAYAEHILVCTGKDDWTSRIEDDEVSDMARGLKALLGRGGKFSDPYHNVLVTNASFAPASTGARDARVTTASATTLSIDKQSAQDAAAAHSKTGSVFLFPSFRFLPHVPLDTPGLEAFVKAFVLPTALHAAHDVLSPSQRATLLRDPSSATQPGLGAQPVTEATVLICGHGGRDSRCGVMGPLLQSEFEDKLSAQGYELLHGAGSGSGDRSSSLSSSASPASSADVAPRAERAERAARVGQISHIGGHKYAGNVIVYVPPTATIVNSNADTAGVKHPLAGCGIWYGRVRPDDVEGIVSETLGKGSIVKDLFRGGVAAGGRPIML